MTEYDLSQDDFCLNHLSCSDRHIDCDGWDYDCPNYISKAEVDLALTRGQWHFPEYRGIGVL